MMLKRGGIFGVLSLCAIPASATVVYSGHDAGAGAPMLTSPTADAAHTAFLSDLIDIRSASFEGYSSGAKPATISFEGGGGPVEAALSGAAYVMGGAPRSTPFANGTFAIDGSSLLQLEQSSFTISFNQAVNAIGFYATDIESDALASLTLASGSIEKYSFNDIFGSSSASSGSVDFLGFTNLAGISSLTLSHAAISDVFGFDSFQIGQVSSFAAAVSDVPEPATWMAFVGGFGLLGGAMRRRQKVAVTFA